MYGSSLRIETWRPRALSNRPMLAAVMPFPREEVTPPVTKTYFDTGQDLRGFSNAIGKPVRGQIGSAAAGRPVQAGSGGSNRPGPQTSGPHENGRAAGRGTSGEP